MDLSTRYLGLTLRNPLVASASPLSQSVAGVRELADAGVGAIVLYSLFEEQIRRQEVEDHLLRDAHEEAFGEALSYFPETVAGSAGDGAAPYLRHLENAAAAVDVPVIASLNGASVGGWVAIARSMQSAGAAAIEINPYAVPGDLASGSSIEQRHVEIVRLVKDAVTVPVAVKLSPFFSSTGAMVHELDRAGVDGVVLFNRFLQPDIDIDTLRVHPAVSLSAPAESGLARTWIAILHGQIRASIAATTGVETSDEIVKYLLAGADAVMTASALLRHGPAYAATLLAGLESWLSRKGFDSVAAVRGLLAVAPGVEAAAYERAGYVAALQQARQTYGDLRVD